MSRTRARSKEAPPAPVPAPAAAAPTASDLLRAAASGDAPGVSRLLGEAAAASSVERNCSAALYVAAQGGHDSVVSVLLKHGVTPAAARNGTTPLHVAAQNGHADIVEMLLACTSIPPLGPPLVVAALRGHVRCVQLLLEAGAPVDHPQASRSLTRLPPPTLTSCCTPGMNKQRNLNPAPRCRNRTVRRLSGQLQIWGDLPRRACSLRRTRTQITSLWTARRLSTWRARRDTLTSRQC